MRFARTSHFEVVTAYLISSIQAGRGPTLSFMTSFLESLPRLSLALDTWKQTSRYSQHTIATRSSPIAFAVPLFYDIRDMLFVLRTLNLVRALNFELGGSSVDRFWIQSKFAVLGTYFRYCAEDGQGPAGTTGLSLSLDAWLTF